MLKLTEVVSHVVGKVCSSSFNMIRHGEGIKDGTSGRPSTIAKITGSDTRKLPAIKPHPDRHSYVVVAAYDVVYALRQ